MILPSPPTQTLSEHNVERYARQIIIPGVGAEGQRRLCAAEVFVDGHPVGRRVASQYLQAAGVCVALATNPPVGIDCIVLAGAADLPGERVKELARSAPLLTWYSVLQSGICGGLAVDGQVNFRPYESLGEPRPDHLHVLHHLAGADVAATTVAALLGWCKKGEYYELRLA
jgi:hypothetical protein